MLDQGLFLTYYDFSQARQILIRFQNNGTRVREDSLDLPDVISAYGEGPLAKLVTFNANPWTRIEMFAVNAFDGNGTRVYQDTLLSTLVMPDHMHGGHALEYSQGVLTLVSNVVRTDIQPLEYTLSVVRYQNRIATAFPPRLAANLPAGTHIFAWTVARGPNDLGVLGFYVGGTSQISELWFEGFDGNGLPVGGVHTIPVGTSSEVNGIQMLVENSSVYACYTTQGAVEGAHGGAYAVGFPLPVILPVELRPEAAVPSELTMAAYPNPFNSAVRIRYQISSSAAVDIAMVDLTGRQVASFHQPATTPLQGEFLWNAQALSSGVYFARFRSGAVQSTIKLMLIR
jgi:hypothetical protein